jgi:hypothetical protein
MRKIMTNSKRPKKTIGPAPAVGSDEASERWERVKVLADICFSLI